MKTLYQKYPKELLNTLPVVQYEGRIVTVLSQDQARKAVDYLLAQPILGVDTETRPSFQRGQHHKTALLQVATSDTCFLFRLNIIGCGPDVKRLLEDQTVPKIGLSWHDDLLQLSHSCDFTPGLFLDLQNHVRELGVEDLSLQKLFANFFGQKISKSQRLTNWEADTLGDKQKSYAAIDAWACLQIWHEYQRLKQARDYILIPAVEDDSQPDTLKKT